VQIGVRELRDGLSKHLAEVRAGRTVTVTDHGRPIARIVPVDRPNRLEQLLAEGKIQPAGRPKKAAPQPITAQGEVSDLIDEQRR